MRRYCFVVTAYAVHDGKVLLLKHKKLGLWLAPGGHIDEGEIPDEAALRELKEEAGLDAEFVVPPRGPNPPGGGVEFLHPPQHVQVETIPHHNHHIDFVYFVRAKSDAVKPGEGESGVWRWHSLEDLDEGHLTEEVRETARRAIALVGGSSRNP